MVNRNFAGTTDVCILRQFAASSSSTSTPSSSPLASILERSSSASSTASISPLSGVSTTSESLATTTSILSAEEKQEIFLRKSKELQTAMKGLMGEKESIQTTLLHARRQKVQNILASAPAPASTGIAAATTTATNTSTNNSKKKKASDIIFTISMSFLTVILAAQLTQSSQIYKKTLLKLEVAEEVITEQRDLLKTIQNSTELQSLAKKIAETINTNDTTSSTTTRASPIPESTIKNRWWLSSSKGVTSTANSKTSDDGTELLFTDSDGTTGGNSIHNGSLLEEHIYQLLSNHVNNVVGDATRSVDEIERRKLEKLVFNATAGTGEQQQQQEQQQVLIEQQSDEESLAQQQQLLDALITEQKQQHVEANDGKRRVFQI
jgi:hypothetical protein